MIGFHLMSSLTILLAGIAAYQGLLGVGIALLIWCALVNAGFVAFSLLPR